MNALTILTLCCAIAGTDAGGTGGDPPTRPELRIKPAVSLRGLHVTVGDLCEITPTNATTAAIAQVRFGPAPVGGYSRAITRTDLVRTLAAAGVQLATVDLTGSDEVVVQTITVDVPEQDLLDAATASLQAQLAVEGGDVEYETPSRVRRCQAPPGRVSQELRARVRGPRTGPNAAIVDDRQIGRAHV